LSDGACWGDVNGDGFLDLYMAHGAEHPPFGVGPRELFYNTPNGNHWMSVELRGLASNGSGVGARVRVVSALGTQWRTRLGDSDGSFANPAAQHFGLGADTVCDSVQIFWPSGQVDVYEGVAADQRYFAVEGAGLRPQTAADFTLGVELIEHAVDSGSADVFDVPVDNLAGRAANYSVRFEDCEGDPVTWMSLPRSTGSIWPGGTGEVPIRLTLDSTGLSGGVYCGRVIFLSNDPTGPDTLAIDLTVATNVSAPSTGGLPASFDLANARPNPLASGGQVTLRLAMPEDGHANVAIYDVGGRLVRTLSAGPLPAGYHDLVWNGRDASGGGVGAGIYLVRATARDVHVTRKVMVLSGRR